jgi:hypothetical protein
MGFVRVPAMAKGKEQEEAGVWNFREVPRDAIVKAKIGAALEGLSVKAYIIKLGGDGEKGDSAEEQITAAVGFENGRRSNCCMQLWEYKFDSIFDGGPIEVSHGKPLDITRWLAEQERRLNDLGGGGWEVVSVLMTEPPYPPGTILLKRPTKERG